MKLNQKEALASIETIRSILERSTRYTHIAPEGIIAGGAIAGAASILGAALGLELPPCYGTLAGYGTRVEAGFLALWGTAFLAAVTTGGLCSARRARKQRETFWSRKLEYVIAGFTPALVGAAVLTAALHGAERLDLAPGVWMLCYGIAIHAVAVVLDGEFRAAAWGFLVTGAVSLVLLRDAPHLCLGIGFGGIHTALGGFRWARERRETWHTQASPRTSRS